jgi:hypothetical protein
MDKSTKSIKYLATTDTKLEKRSKPQNVPYKLQKCHATKYPQ